MRFRVVENPWNLFSIGSRGLAITHGAADTLKAIFSFGLVAVVAMPTRAALPQIGVCPSGYHESGGYCALDAPGIGVDDCMLFLWATAPMLPDALRAMAAWGIPLCRTCLGSKTGSGRVIGLRTPMSSCLLERAATFPRRLWASNGDR